MAELVYPTDSFLHFHNDLANVAEHADGYVSIEWKPAPMRTRDLREVYDQALELLRRTGFSRILTDHQLMSPLQPSDREWLIHNWVPRAVQAGYERCAVLRSHNPFSRQALQEVVVQLTAVPLIIRYFDERHLATNWLLT